MVTGGRGAHHKGHRALLPTRTRRCAVCSMRRRRNSPREEVLAAFTKQERDALAWVSSTQKPKYAFTATREPPNSYYILLCMCRPTTKDPFITKVGPVRMHACLSISTAFGEAICRYQGDKKQPHHHFERTRKRNTDRMKNKWPAKNVDAAAAPANSRILDEEAVDLRHVLRLELGVHLLHPRPQHAGIPPPRGRRGERTRAGGPGPERRRRHPR